MLTVDFVENKKEDSSRYALLNSNKPWVNVSVDEIEKVKNDIIRADTAHEYVKNLFYVIFEQHEPADMLEPKDYEKLKQSGYYRKYVCLTKKDINDYYEEFKRIKMEKNQTDKTEQIRTEQRSSFREDNHLTLFSAKPESKDNDYLDVLNKIKEFVGVEFQMTDITGDLRVIDNLRSEAVNLNDSSQVRVPLEYLSRQTSIRFKEEAINNG